MQKGLSVLELIVVIALVALLSAVVAHPFSQFRDEQSLENTTNTAVSVLSEARSKTLAQVAGTTYGVRFETNRAILFSGATYDPNASTNQYFPYDTPVTMTAISLADSGTQVTFDRLKGTTGSYGTIIFTLGSTLHAHTVSVGASGSVSRD